LESEGEAGSGTRLACLVILDKKAKKEKKKRNFRGRKWLNSQEPEKPRKLRLKA